MGRVSEGAKVFWFFFSKKNILPHMTSIGAIMRNHRGVGPGFDSVRLFLAAMVVLWHTRQLSYGRGTVWLPVYILVPAFFALSGFLVAGSMVRVGRVGPFLALRALRIVPALAAEVCLSALVLGSLTTSLTLRQYFTDPRFAQYFTNMIGIIRYQLPGVFLQNPLPGVVNGQLWTVPAELRCYAALALLMAGGIAMRRWLMLAAFIGLATAECLTALLPAHHYTPGVMNAQEMLILCFLCGTVFFLWREAIPWHPLLFLAAVAVYFGVGAYIPALTFLVGTVAVCYAVVFAGTCRVPRIPVPMRGDYSYGLYLYAFPMQQAVAWALPGARQWYVSLLIAGPLALGCAILSWHFIEKPALRLKRHLVPDRRSRAGAQAGEIEVAPR
jgi:peptidoglycan/LPS O-acetylase OafA/YrhL